MPQNVNNAVSTGVMPSSLCTTLVESRTYPVLINEYPDGSSQRKLQAVTSRKRFRIGKRLTPEQMTTLRTFYRNNVGKAFVIYPLAKHYDASGQSLTGRYLVRFEGPWSESFELSRGTCQLEFVELA